MNVDFDLYEGKSYKDLMRDIVVNSEINRDQIDIVISDLRDQIKTINDAVILAPIIKEYLDVSVKNDDALIKLAAVCQRLISSTTGGEEGNSLLTDQEKEQLLKTIKEVNLSVKDDVDVKKKELK